MMATKMVVLLVVVSVWSELSGPVFFLVMEYGHTNFSLLFSHCLKCVILICAAG